MNIKRLNERYEKCFQYCTRIIEKYHLIEIFNILVFCFITGLSFWLFDANLEASWGMIDDHEIVHYIGSDGVFGFSEIIPTLLTKTEINPDATTPRFRPAYYFLRLLETRLWYRHAPLEWYTFRLFIFIFFLSVLYLFFKNINGRIIGTGLVIWISNFDFWDDIFSRLGPAEIYAVLGLGIFIIGVMFYQRKKESLFAWLLMMIGIIFSTGSKENMMIFLVPYVYLFVKFLLSKPQRKLIPWITVITSLLWFGWIGVNIFSRLIFKGSDIYNNPISVVDRFGIISSSIIENIWFFVALSVFSLLGFFGWIFIKKVESKKIFSGLFFGSLIIALLFFSQKIFYDNVIWGRYYFPIKLALPLFISLISYTFLQFSRVQNLKPLHFFISLVLLVVICLNINFEYWIKVHDRSINNVENTQSFSNKLHQITYHLSTYPKSSIVLLGYDAETDYEATFSYMKFIRAANIINKMFILRELPQDFKIKPTSLQAKLESDLYELSTNGSLEFNILPLDEFNSDPEDCLLVRMNFSTNSSINCNYVIDLNLNGFTADY